MLPSELLAVLPHATATAWPKVVAALPDGAYLAGGTALAVHLGHRISRDLDVFVGRPFRTDQVRRVLERSGTLTVTTLTGDTLNGLLDGTKVQFLTAPCQLLDPPTVVANMPVAGVRDLMADKLKVVRDRGELRDYFDLMAIEQAGTHRCEQGLRYYLKRYRLGPDDSSLAGIVRALGYLDDVADDPGLPVGRDVVESYWQRRHLELTWSLASFSRPDIGTRNLLSVVPPQPSVPRPTSTPGRCGSWMPRARARCVLPLGHRGSHRSR